MLILPPEFDYLKAGGPTMPQMKFTIDGWARWELVTEDDELIAEGEQHNLYLNQGLNLLAIYGMNVSSHNTTTMALARGNQAYACIGTGNTAPSFADTTLVNETNRSGNRHTNTADTITRVSNGVYDTLVVREFSTGISGSFTEWGFSPTTTGNLAVRELFRDGALAPITVNKATNQKLRLFYTNRWTLGPISETTGSFVFETQDFTGAILTSVTKNGKYILAGGSSGGSSDFAVMDQFMRGVGGSIKPASAVVPALNYNSSIGGLGGSSSTNYAAYVNGSYSRTATHFFDTPANNFVIYGFCTDTNLDNFGWQFKFDTANEITKDSDNTLTIVGPTITWART